MAEKLKQLHGLLLELQASTTGGEAADMSEQELALLQTVQQDISRLVGKSGETPTDIEGSEVESVADSLRKALLDFEVEHPQLTSLLGRIGNALANLGI